MLFIEYQQAWLDAAVAELQSIDGVSTSLNLFDQSSFKPEEVQQFQYWFDWYCKYTFVNCMNIYNDYMNRTPIYVDCIAKQIGSPTRIAQPFSLLAVTDLLCLRSRVCRRRFFLNRFIT
jgi:hypothetical protein